MNQPKLVLYSQPFCPFCIKVVSYLEKRNINIEIKNVISDPDARNTLLSVGGKTQVPCLFIDGKPLYESDDIIAWFENNSV